MIPSKTSENAGMANSQNSLKLRTLHGLSLGSVSLFFENQRRHWYHGQATTPMDMKQIAVRNQGFWKAWTPYSGSPSASMTVAHLRTTAFMMPNNKKMEHEPMKDLILWHLLSSTVSLSTDMKNDQG